MPAPKKGAAARQEVAGSETNTVETHGLTLKIPAKIPFAVLRHIDDDMTPKAVIGVLGTLLGDEQMDTVWEAGLDMEQGVALLEDIMGAAGFSVGESQASPTS